MLIGCGGGSGGTGDDSGSGGVGSGSDALVVDVDPLRAAPAADTARTVTPTVALGGGSLSATGADGSVYTLTVPADALVEPTEISLTPLGRLAVDGLPSDAAYGVQLGPEGAQFSNFITLTITPPPGASVPIERQLPIGWSGADNIVSLAALDPTAREIKLQLLHFSGYALLLARQGTDATLEPVRHRLGGDAETRLQSLAAERLAQERRRQLLAQSETTVDLTDLFQAYDEQVLKPRIAAAGRLAIQTVLGRSRQRQLLGLPDDDYGHSALYGDLMARATSACTREELTLCRDEHVITRMLPYYLGLRRQSELLGLATADPSGDPVWLQEAAEATAGCLNFELQFDSQLELSNGAQVGQHSVREHVSARLPLPFNLGVALFGEGRLYAASSTGPSVLASSGYSVAYTHTCASVANAQGINAGMMASIGYVPGTGTVSERAVVQDFYLTPAVIPVGLGSQYQRTLRAPRQNGCEDPITDTVYESWVVDGYPAMLDAFADPDLGAAIRGWTIVGGDILGTKDFTVRLAEDEKTVTVQTSLVLFHKPLP